MPAPGKDAYVIRSVENALSLLEALGDDGGELSLAHLSLRLGMNKASLFRLLATFERRGYVVRGQDSRLYRPGPAAFDVGRRMLSRMALLRQARPVMTRLARDCGEAVYLVVAHRGEALFLDVVEGYHQVRVVSLVGKRFALKSCAAGRVLLAWGAEQAGTEGLEADELAAVLSCGASVVRGGVGQESASAAAPFFAGSGNLIGALALVGPDFRMSDAALSSRLLPALRAAASGLSRRLDCCPDAGAAVRERSDQPAFPGGGRFREDKDQSGISQK